MRLTNPLATDGGPPSDPPWLEVCDASKRRIEFEGRTHTDHAPLRCIVRGPAQEGPGVIVVVVLHDEDREVALDHSSRTDRSYVEGLVEGPVHGVHLNLCR